MRNDRLNLENVDAIFVFSGGVNSRGLVMGEAIDRLLTGIAMRARRPALPLVISNVRADNTTTAATSAADQRALIAMAPAAGPVESIDSVWSTRDEAVKLTRRAFQARWKRVAVVTSPMHTRRACATVEELGLAVTCVAAPWRPSGWPARTPSDRGAHHAAPHLRDHGLGAVHRHRLGQLALSAPHDAGVAATASLGGTGRFPVVRPDSSAGRAADF